MKKYLLLVSFCLLCSSILLAQKNVLLIIADDLGVDYSNGYQQNNLMPTTPHLDGLRSSGLTFKNVWAAPVCTPTRSRLMSAKHGVKTNVLTVPGHLDTSHFSLFRAMDTLTNNAYAQAIVGKWHISQGSNSVIQPALHGVDHYAGVIGGAVSDYYDWTKVTNGVTTQITNDYVTSHFTRDAIQWVNSQSQPWFLWLAHVAPHTPYHIPPSGTFSIGNTGNNKRKYVAMIESLDYHIGQLLDSIPQNVLDSTLIIYIGDNGTPNNTLQNYPSGHGKSSLFQGGIHVPMIINGAGVSRQGQTEDALINVTDLHATILEYVGANLPGGTYNSLSFDHLLDGSSGPTRKCNYMDFTNNANVVQWAIRNEDYKLIETDTAGQLFFDLVADPLENNNLINSLTAAQDEVKDSLEAEAMQIRSAWSCKDHIQNGDETGIDCGGTYCAPCTPNSLSDLVLEDFDVWPNPVYDFLNFKTRDKGSYKLFDLTGKLLFNGNVIRGQNRISTARLMPGLYTFKVQVGNKIAVQKFFKE